MSGIADDGTLREGETRETPVVEHGGGTPTLTTPPTPQNPTGSGQAGSSGDPPVAEQPPVPVATGQLLADIVEQLKALRVQRDLDVESYSQQMAALRAAGLKDLEDLKGQAGRAFQNVEQTTSGLQQQAPMAAGAAQAAAAAAHSAEQTARRAAIGALPVQPPPPNAPIKTPNPPKFRGVGKEPKILEWTYQATNYLRAVGLVDHEQGVWHITNFLEGDAATWWRLQVDAMEKGAAAPILTWAHLKGVMIERFQVFNHQVDVRDRYTTLRQTSTVAKYINDFRALVVELAYEPMESQIYQFLKGLKPSIQASTRTHKPTSLLQAMDIADEADRATYHAYGGTPSTSKSTGRGWVNRSRGNARGDTSGPAPMQLGAVQHAAKSNAAKSYAEKQECMRKNLCFKCMKAGHVARDCKSGSRRKAGN